jgi:hypothetical protein
MGVSYVFLLLSEVSICSCLFHGFDRFVSPFSKKSENNNRTNEFFPVCGMGAGSIGSETG